MKNSSYTFYDEPNVKPRGWILPFPECDFDNEDMKYLTSIYQKWVVEAYKGTDFEEDTRIVWPRYFKEIVRKFNLQTIESVKRITHVSIDQWLIPDGFSKEMRKCYHRALKTFKQFLEHWNEKRRESFRDATCDSCAWLYQERLKEAGYIVK